jgi:hypothetical protein
MKVRRYYRNNYKYGASAKTICELVFIRVGVNSILHFANSGSIGIN